jgi:type IV pilus assembly protein PilN
MIQINLLPWRDAKRESEKKEFTILMIVAFCIGIAFVFFMNYQAQSSVDAQSVRNQRLQTEIDLFNKQILEIKNITTMRDALIKRMKVVHDLQSSRTLTVHIFDELIKIMPSGIYISKITKAADRVTLLGHSESNSNVSILMKNIEKNPWIQAPILTEIKKSDDDTKEPVDLNSHLDNDFNLSFIIKPK